MQNSCFLILLADLIWISRARNSFISSTIGHGNKCDLLASSSMLTFYLDQSTMQLALVVWERELWANNEMSDEDKETNS